MNFFNMNLRDFDFVRYFDFFDYLIWNWNFNSDWNFDSFSFDNFIRNWNLYFNILSIMNDLRRRFDCYNLLLNGLWSLYLNLLRLKLSYWLNSDLLLIHWSLNSYFLNCLYFLHCSNWLKCGNWLKRRLNDLLHFNWSSLHSYHLRRSHICHLSISLIISSLVDPRI